MATVEMKMDLSKLNVKLTEARKIRDQAMPQIYQHFRDLTPVAAQNGGNARNNTSYHANQIVANYPYAFVLDAGRSFRDGQMRGSDQAPKGMTEPTKEFAKKLIPQLVKKVWSR